MPQEVCSTEGAPELRGAGRRHHSWKPRRRPPWDHRESDPGGHWEGASGFKGGAFKGPLETSQPPGSREVVPRHAEHQGADPEGPTGMGWGQQGWAWNELSVLRQACPCRTAPRPGHNAWLHTQPIFSFTGETGSLPLGEGRTEHPSSWGQMRLV